MASKFLALNRTSQSWKTTRPARGPGCLISSVRSREDFLTFPEAGAVPEHRFPQHHLFRAGLSFLRHGYSGFYTGPERER